MEIKQKLVNSELLAAICGGVSAGIGAFVIFGWLINSTSLIQILPHFAPMQFNTALCFLLAGTAIISFICNKFSVSKIAAILLLSIAVLTSVEYLFSISLGIDSLFVNSPAEQAKTIFAGRMSPPTTICFFLSALALLVLNFPALSKKTPLLLGLKASLVFSLALSTIVGYFLNFESTHAAATLLGMALHTAAGFLFVGAGIFTFAISKEARYQKLLPRWIGAPVAVVVLCLSVVIWQSLLTQEFHSLKSYMNLQSTGIRQILDEKLTLHFNSLQRMAFRIENIKGMSQVQWHEDVSLFLRHFESYEGIVHVGPNLKIVDQVSDRPHDNFLELFDATVLKSLRAKSRKDSQFVYSWTPTKAGKSALLLVVPLFNDNKFDGFVCAILDAGKFLDFGYSLENSIDYSVLFKIDDANHELFGECCPDLNKSLITHLEFEDFRGAWIIKSWPTENLIEHFSTQLPLAVLFGGSVLALLVSLLIHLGLTAQYRSVELAEANTSLESKVADRTKELQARDEFTRGWLSNCTDGAWDWDLEKNTVFMTPQFKELLGYNEDELSDGVDIWRKLVPPMDLQVADKAYQDYINNGQRYAYQLRWIHKNGSMVWTLCRGEGIKNETGKIVRMVGTLTDISKHKRLEEELIHWAEQLERKNSDLERFNRLAVGREKRMIELKAKVNELYRQLGQPEPYNLAFKDQKTVGTAYER